MVKEESQVVFEKGVDSVAITRKICADNLQYITGMKHNRSDDKIIAAFGKYYPEIIDVESGIRGITNGKPGNTTYNYFPLRLQKELPDPMGRKVVRPPFRQAC